MKKIAVILVPIFVLVTVFAFTIMRHEGHSRATFPCPADIVEGTLCSDDEFSIVGHHVSAYQTFSAAFAAFSIVLVSVFAYFKLSSLLLSVDRLPFVFISSQATQRPFTRSFVQKRHWLSHLEHSPPKARL